MGLRWREGGEEGERTHLSQGEVMKLPGDPQFLHELFPVSLLQCF